METNRRTFLKTSLLGAAALSLPARLRASADGANGDIRVAVIGFNGRGGDHISGYSKLKGVRLVALCDVDQAVLDKGVANLKSKGMDVEGFTDIRKLLEKKDLDAVSIATPNHWHSLAAIWSIEAGKDVYVEKPISHNVWEGRQLVKKAEASKQIVQMGVQSRSAWGLRQGLAFGDSGNLGKLTYVRGLCYKRRPSIGKVAGPQRVPSTVDYDLWCGPAEKLPLTRAKLHYDWHWVWNTGNGDLGNQGIHQMDIARRFLGEQTLSPKVYSVGGRLGYIDDGETPNSLFVVHEYKKAPLIFEVRGLPESANAKSMDKLRGVEIGVIAQYEGGYIISPNYNDAVVYDNDGKETKKFVRPKEVNGQAGGRNRRVQREPLPEFHRLRSKQERGCAERKDHRRASLKRTLPHRQYLLPPRRESFPGRIARDSEGRRECNGLVAKARRASRGKQRRHQRR